MPTSVQWWKNGDHPEDDSETLTDSAGAEFLSEGQVVRRFRDPDVTGTDLCLMCGQAYDVHGWIDGATYSPYPEGQIVHPGDFVEDADGDKYIARRADPLADALALAEAQAQAAAESDEEPPEDPIASVSP